MCCPFEIKCGVCLLVSDGYKCLNGVAGKCLPDFLLLKGNQDLSTAASILLQCSALFLTSKHRALCSSAPVIPSLCSFSPYLMSYAGHSPHYLPQCKQPRLHASEYLTHINIFLLGEWGERGKTGADKWDWRSSKAHKFTSLKQQGDYNSILSLTLILLLEYALFRGMKYSQWIFWIGENE